MMAVANIGQLLTIDGRINRTEYIVYSFLYSLCILGVGLPFQYVLQYVHQAVSLTGGLITVLVYAVFMGVLTIRRVHDFDERGWFALIAFIPLANLYLFLSPGTPMPNRFGNPPPPSRLSMKVLAASALVWPVVALAVIVIFEIW